MKPRPGDKQRFQGTIGPSNLLDLVRNTAPFYFSEPPPEAPGDGDLASLARGPWGWWKILLAANRLTPSENPTPAQRADYFALCLACHHATVATYIPTDVDSKIRGVLWQRERNEKALSAMQALTVEHLSWDVPSVTTRLVTVGSFGHISGHDGERFSVLAGALVTALRRGQADLAATLVDRIDGELAREAGAFDEVQATAGREIDLLRLAALLTHNVGDLDQGMSYWPKAEPFAALKQRFGRLAHENARPYNGSFARAALLYRTLLASEGHRHYPLRAVAPLRASRALLLPLAPFLDDWGATVATHPALDLAGRREALAAMLLGTEKVPNQVGYHRAISGFARAMGGSFRALAEGLPTAPRKQLREAPVQKHLGIEKISFESGFKKQARALLGG